MKKLIYTSSVTAMDRAEGLKNVDETSPLTWYSHYGSTKSIVEPVSLQVVKK